MYGSTRFSDDFLEAAGALYSDEFVDEDDDSTTSATAWTSSSTPRRTR